MSKKTKIFLLVLIIIGLLLSLIYKLIVSYYFEYDRETIEPDEETKICNINVLNFQDRKVFYVSPKNEKTDLTIIYFHGGAYMAEATDEHWDFIQKLAIDSNATIIMPDYPLAPKSNYKDVYNMVEPLYKEIISGVNTNNLIVMGDSAGGGLALGLMEKISSENIKLPNKIILISPWLDIRLKNPKIDEVQKRDKQLKKDVLKLAGISYAVGNNNYLVNPIDGDLSKLKNITIFIGTDDILNPDAHLIEEKAKGQGINIKLKEYENAGHIWMIEKNANEELIEKGYKEILEEVRK